MSPPAGAAGSRQQTTSTALVDALVWDAHCGFAAGVDIDLERLARFRAAGVSYLSLNIGYDLMTWHEAFKVAAAYRAWVQAHDGDYLLAETVEDVERARAEGRLAIAFDLEGLNALDGDVALIEVYHRLGVRQMLFAYNRNNAFGGGCHDDDVGLTALGRRAVEEMNRVGVLVDCSHTSYHSTMEAMELSAAPVVFSHSNPIAVWDHPRNVRDDQIRACAATGGVVGINGLGIFLGENDASTETILRHVDHVAELVGPAHVGVGLDASFGDDPAAVEAGFGPAAAQFWPPGHGYEISDPQVAEPEQLLELGELLLARGYDRGDVRGILGGNFLRVARVAWRPPG